MEITGLSHLEFGSVKNIDEGGIGETQGKKSWWWSLGELALGIDSRILTASPKSISTCCSGS